MGIRNRIIGLKSCVVWISLAAVLTLPAAEGEKAGESPALPEGFEKPMPLYPKALGELTRPISSESKEAQAYFDQGLQLRYSFSPKDGVRSFREAHKRDPRCAICYWGEAWAWGSYLNGAMSESDAPHAYAALQKAIELAPENAAPVEQALIEALSVRYVEKFEKEMKRELDEAYAEAMRKVYERYPDDLEVGTLYAEALFLLEPRRGERDLNDPNVRRLHRVLEKVLDADIKHPGACHLYVHATESTVEPGKAEACAEYLGDAIPGASHMNHMPSHTWNQIGRWGDAVRANLQAWHSDLKAEIGEGIAIYPQHNLHMLLFAASMDGQGAIAIQAAKDFAKGSGNNMYHMLTLIRFGRFDEAPLLTDRPEGTIPAGYWDFGQGYAKLRLGEPEFARAYLKRLEAATSSEETLREHKAEDLIGTLAAILEGEIRREEGDLRGAIKSFERAVELYDNFPYSEPEVLPFSAHHWLGAALIEAGRPAKAERVYREDLKAHPHNGWSLFGLKAALAGQGKSSPEVDADFESSWARSDVWIRASRF